MNAPLKTLQEVLGGATDYLTKREIESPRLNAEHLLAHVLALKRMDLYLQFDRPMTETELAPMRELLKKRGQGIPLQHLLGTVEFHGRSFACDGRALVPRSETEHLIELIIERVKSSPLQHILDVGTGSGVIALTLAAEFSGAAVTACDVSPDALVLALENAQKWDPQGRVSFIVSDLLENIAGEFDLIVANLPYIPTAEIAGLAVEVRHDPALALDGGADGRRLIERLLIDSRAHLAPEGLIALEIHHDQSAAVLAFAEALGYGQTSASPDYHGINRFLFINHG